MPFKFTRRDWVWLAIVLSLFATLVATGILMEADREKIEYLRNALHHAKEPS